MADLRIVDAPEIPTENITGEEKLPMGGSGNYSISLDSLADYTKTKKDLADNTSVDGKVNGVRQELDAHIEDLLNPHQVTKGQIGLGNVDNTADADKPVSNSTQAAIISAVSPKADKTYVDNQLTLKANKVDVYTKQESSDLVNNSISTALTPINTSLDLVKRGVANRYDSSLTYNAGERVVLANGDIVKSTIDGNASDPNVDIAGWKLDQNIKTLSSISELLSSKPDRLSFVSSYHVGLGLGGGDFLPVQSSLLVENGVTIFKSLVVGFEDYYWVRANTNYITPEMAGAKGNKVDNDRSAWQKCLDIGGKIVTRDGAKYLIDGDDITTHVDTSLLICEKSCSIESQNKSSLYFLHHVTTGSPIEMTVRGVDSNIDGFTLSGLNIFGHTDRGHPVALQRCWGTTFRGVNNLVIKNCKFSTNQGRPFTVNRRADVDWIQSTDLNVANTKAAVMRLLDLSSKNVTIENIEEEYFASAGFAIFGGNGVYVDGVYGDSTGSAFPYLAWTDDASSQTRLLDYAVNTDIHFKNIRGIGEVSLDSTASGSIVDCTVAKVGYRSYDFDQQKNNFDFGTHIYNQDDHLNEPFLWMKYFDRHIDIRDNTCQQVNVRGIYSDIHSNYINTTADAQSLIVFTGNGISWGNGASYFDYDETVNIGVKNTARNNTFIVKHSNCFGVDYGSVSPTSRINAIDNIVELTKDGLSFSPIRPFSQSYRRESHFLTSVNDGLTLSKRINHHVDVRQSMLTQGVGFNHLKTFANIYGSSGAQTIANFTNTATSVEFFIVLLDTSGLMARKKVSVSSANAVTVTDLDSQSSYNASFTVVVTSGVVALRFTPTARDITLDIAGIGVNGNCIFLAPAVRSAATGG